MQADQINQASIIVELMQIAVAAPDVPSAVTPILERLAEDTAAEGAAYFQERDDMYVSRATFGRMPEGPVMEQIMMYGLPGETPLMVALKESPQPFFFNDTEREDTTTGFPELGVVGLAAAPVRDIDGHFVGAFLMHTFERHTWTATEANLFAAMTGALANLIARLVAEEQLAETREQSLRALGLALEYRDREPVGHIDRVAEMALAIGEHLKLNEQQTLALRWGAYLHDIGKNAISDDILLKPDSLTEDERETVREHASAGRAFAEKLGFLPEDSLDLILHHHERWDGTGYPSSLAGNDIPLLARIFSVCDVYDALTSSRPYRQAWTHEDTMAEIRSQSGKQFDPDIVDAVVAVRREN
jgi:putative nucleotidyltransferase with HDIG domain